MNLSLLENANIQPKQKQTRRDGSFIVTSGPSLVGRLRAEAWVSASFQIFAISPNIVRSTIFDITRPIVTLTLSLPLATIYIRSCTSAVGDYSRPVPLADVGDGCRRILLSYLKVEFYCNKGLASASKNLAAKTLIRYVRRTV